MKFALATLHVQDMEKSLDFYNRILEIPILRRQQARPGVELIFLGIEGQPNLELIPAAAKVGHTGFSIGFEVDNLQKMKARLAENGYSIEREMSPGGNTTLCFLQGPDGEEVELIAYS